MRIPKQKSSCSICLEEGDGFHFGAEACKACAAFFRRSVALNKTYHCRADGYCDVTINIRCMCRACRFSKCLQMGMNPSGVQNRKAPEPPVPTSDFPSTSLHPPLLMLANLPQIFHNQMPLLTKMSENYQKLANARTTIFRNFYTPYFMMEGAFLSHISNKSDAVVMPSGDYIDMNQLELFYKEVEVKEPMTKDQIEKLFKPSYDMHRKSLMLPMMSEQLDVFEFFALTTLILWDTGLENLTESTIQTGKKVKDQMMRELAFYLKNIKKIDEPVVRVASILSLIPAAYKSTRRIQDDLEMTQIFNIYTPSKEFYDMVHGNFC